ncbi:MAG: 8-oxo-dGTP diphosphatase [Verrucomicrobiales bacterium]
MTDWATWEPTMRATLLFVVQDGQVLLIRKKRGLGAGKINGPGGRLDPGESYMQCAVREVNEELGIVVHDPVRRGELHFQFVDGLALYCRVFVGSQFAGTPVETDEAIPLWWPVDALPYEEMWADDRHWLGPMLAGQSFRAWFDFDQEIMLTHRVEWGARILIRPSSGMERSDFQ